MLPSTAVVWRSFVRKVRGSLAGLVWFAVRSLILFTVSVFAVRSLRSALHRAYGSFARCAAVYSMVRGSLDIIYVRCAGIYGLRMVRGSLAIIYSRRVRMFGLCSSGVGAQEPCSRFARYICHLRSASSGAQAGSQGSNGFAVRSRIIFRTWHRGTCASSAP